MHRNKILLKFCFALFLISALLRMQAQNLSSFLRHVAENNPEITAYGKLLEARRIEAFTGNTPPGPEVSFGYMPGDASTDRVKKIWSVNQRFDFPSKYLLQKKINKNSVLLAEQEYELGKLLILLDAKMTLYDYLFTRRYYDVLVKRCDDVNRLLDVWKKKLDAGAATILEFNRIALELSLANLEKNKTAAEVSALEKKLIYMSGGRGVIPEVIDYPDIIAAGPDELAEQKVSVHPSFLIPRTEFLISTGELNLSKTGALPGLSLGLSSEIIPGETFTGPVVGLSIPLWANANRVKSASASVKRAEAHMNAEVARLKTEVFKEYGKMLALQSAMEELREIIRTNSGVEYLNKALNEGEITLADYFSFLGVITNAEEKLIVTEREYCKSAALLTDHELLNLLRDQNN